MDRSDAVCIARRFEGPPGEADRVRKIPDREFAIGVDQVDEIEKQLVPPFDAGAPPGRASAPRAGEQPLAPVDDKADAVKRHLVVEEHCDQVAVEIAARLGGAGFSSDAWFQ